VFVAYLRLDNIQFNVTIHTYSFEHFTKALGGTVTFWLTAFTFLTLAVNRKLFVQDVLGDLFLVNQDKVETESNNVSVLTR
jgi:hypothetical protein